MIIDRQRKISELQRVLSCYLVQGLALEQRLVAAVGVAVDVGHAVAAGRHGSIAASPCLLYLRALAGAGSARSSPTDV